jgi:PAS domain S-box-containing protein
MPRFSSPVITFQQLKPMPPEFFNPTYYALNLYALAPFVAALAIIILGMVVLVSERYSRVSITFHMMTLTAGIWLSGYGVMYCALSESAAMGWASIGLMGVTLIPASVYHFTVEALKLYPKHKHRVWLTWLIGGAFFITAVLSDSFFSGVSRFWWGYYPRFNWLSIIFLFFFFGSMAVSLRQYWLEVHHAETESARKRSRALLGAFCVAYLASFDYFAAFGIPLYPFGYLPIVGFVLLAARAIWRYRLVDITPAFAAGEIINAMEDALLVLDVAGIVRVANGSACELFGRTEDQLVGSSIQTITEPLAAPDVLLDRLILRGSLRDFETDLPNPRNGITTVSTSAFAVRDQAGQPVAFVCIVRDVTEQKKAQREIQRHTERQTALYEVNLATTSTLELHAVLNVLLDKVTALVPDTVATIMLLGSNGQQLVKVVSRGVDEAAWKQDTEPSEHLGSHPVAASKETIWIANIQVAPGILDSGYFRKNGFRSYLGIPLLAQDKVLGILSFYSRRERSYSDEEIHFLTTLAGQAAGAIHNSQLFEQTRQQATDLERASRVKDEFLSVMSHELRTPLNIIAGYTKIVQDGLLGDVNAEQVKALDKVSRHSNEMLVMVNSIMAATKIEAGVVNIECDEFSLADFLDDLKLLYDYSFGKNVTLAWDYPENLPVIRTDRDKLKHIIQNLVNNALKFTDEGVVKISARQAAGTDRVELSVADTGIGIADEDLPSIFDRFRQVDSSRTRSHGGVGLGLHIVKTFAQLLGGTIDVVSQPGKGSTFTIALPRVWEGLGAVRTIVTRRVDGAPKG